MLECFCDIWKQQPLGLTILPGIPMLPLSPYWPTQIQKWESSKNDMTSWRDTVTLRVTQLLSFQSHSTNISEIFKRTPMQTDISLCVSTDILLCHSIPLRNTTIVRLVRTCHACVNISLWEKPPLMQSFFHSADVWHAKAKLIPC